VIISGSNALPASNGRIGMMSAPTLQTCI
jgi:hypothetical protein